MADTKHSKEEIIARLRAGRIRALESGVKFGMATGTKTKKTIKREQAQKIIDQIISHRSSAIVRATLLPALGMNFVYRIDEEIDLKGKVTNRKHILVEDPDEIAMALDQMEAGGQHPEDKYYYVTTRAPEYKAGESLLNRLLGKPKESLSVDVEHRFSLKDLGKQADKLENQPVRQLDYTEKKQDNTPSSAE